MNIFKFVQNYYETRQITYDWHEDVLNLILSYSVKRFHENGFNTNYKSIREQYEQRKNRKELPTYSNGILDMFTKYYPVEWEKDNISHSAMDKFNIRFSTSQNKIIIPHYNVNNELIGIRGRALNQYEVDNFGKYMPVQIENKWYSHPLSLNLYGLNVNKDNIRNRGICYVFESEKSVLQSEDFGLNCSVAVCGSQFNKYQVDLLLRHAAPKEIIICFDKEEKKSEDKYFQKLWNIGKKYQNYCNFSFVYDRENLLSMKDSPSDRGKEIFDELVKRRVIIK